jgi:hypothetical protein
MIISCDVTGMTILTEVAEESLRVTSILALFGVGRPRERGHDDPETRGIVWSSNSDLEERRSVLAERFNLPWSIHPCLLSGIAPI